MTTVGSIDCTSLCSLGVTNGPAVFDAVVNFAVANFSAVAGASICGRKSGCKCFRHL
jgi:hypothetical protein